MHSPGLPREALVRTWARVNGHSAHALVDGPHLVVYRAENVDIIQRTGRNIRWRIANHAGTVARVSVGWRRFR